MFGLKRASVATPPPTASQRPADGADTVPPLELVPRDVKHLLATVESLRDDVLWLRERYEKLQARVVAELREIRREVDSFYDGDEESE